MKKTQHKALTALSIIFGLLSAGILLTACSSDDEQEQTNDGRKLRQLTLYDVPVTRATLTDNSTTLGAAWKADDQATYINLTTKEPNTKIEYDNLTAVTSAASSAFTGSVSCSKGDQIAFYYPAKEPIIQGSDWGKYTVNLAGQKGTLDDVATNYHYVYGVGSISGVTETTATGSILSMKSLLAVCKFTFTDGSNPISVKKLSISYYDITYGQKLDYPQTALVTPSLNQNEVTAVPAGQDEWEDPLEVTLDNATADGVVYVALFPTNNAMHFTVVDNDGKTYTGTATANLSAGRYYTATLTVN